jgi:O-antigen/teichoic acid export membrane protein
LETATIAKPLPDQATTRHLTASIGKNTLFGIVASFAQVATRLVTVPIIIAHLGLGGYGIWSIIMNAAAYMRFGSAGIKSAFQKYVAEATGNGDYLTANRLLSTGTAVMVVLSVIGLIPIAFFSRTLAKAAGVPPEFLHASAWAISMLALFMIFANGGAAYDAAVLGGHRIDLARKFNTVLCVAEAVAIIVLLRFGFGLIAMTAVMTLSELAFITSCYVASHRVVPLIRLSPKYVTKSVLPELVRFAGSYQLMNIMQVIYGAIVPIAILRAYGASAAGIFALGTRLVSPVTMCIYAFLLPILSGGTMVFASGSVEKMRVLLAKSFKVTLLMTLLPLGLICAFGSTLILAWTGQADPHIPATLWLVSAAVLFQAFSLLGLVLYRASGKALMDMLREVLRIVIILITAAFAAKLGFYGVLAGMAVAELISMIFMLVALKKTYPIFEAKALVPEILRLTAATFGIVFVGVLAGHISFVPASNARMFAVWKMGAVILAILISAYPILFLTGSVSKSEVRSILGVFRKNPAST